MRTTIFLAFFLLLGSLSANANPGTDSGNTFCLSCNVPDGLTVGNFTGNSATLSWNAVAGATRYTVEVEDEQNNPSTFHVETNVNTNTYVVTGLQNGVLYKFKVRTRCGSNKSDWSEWVFFTGGGSGSGSGTCATVTGLTATVLNGVATLGWNAVNGAQKYYIEVEDEQNNPSTFHLEDFSATNSYILNGLQTGVLYKFKVRTHCANGQSDWSGWMFFNGNGTNPGGTGSATCAVPTALTASLNGSSATLSWSAVSGATQYYLEVEDEQNNPSTFHIEISVQDTFYKLPGLQTGVLYKFKVRSHCSGGDSDWSPWSNFKIMTTNTTVITNSFTTTGHIPLTYVFDLQVWPNPAQTLTTVHLQNLSPESSSLRLFNLAGHLVLEQRFMPEADNWEASLNLGDLPNGLYLVQAQNGANTQTAKLMVAK